MRQDITCSNKYSNYYHLQRLAYLVLEYRPGLRSLQRSRDDPVLENKHCGYRGYLEFGRYSGVFIDVHLGVNYLSLVLLCKVFEYRGHDLAWSAPFSPEV